MPRVGRNAYIFSTYVRFPDHIFVSFFLSVNGLEICSYNNINIFFLTFTGEEAPSWRLDQCNDRCNEYVPFNLTVPTVKLATDTDKQFINLKNYKLEITNIFNHKIKRHKTDVCLF